MTIAIKEIGAESAFAVRHPVLRSGKPLESCAFDGDMNESTKHFGLFENGRLAGVVSAFAAANPVFTSSHQWQLRGMAVLAADRQKSYGNRLINHIETEANKRKIELIWFNARELAIGFYEKNGYSVIGNPFEINDIGMHFVMYKNLDIDCQKKLPNDF